MALIFSDTFTETTTTALTSHVPDTGTGWTQEVAATGAVANASGGDYVVASANVTGDDLAVSAQPNPTQADVDVQMTLAALLTGTGSAPFGVFARWADSSNFYGVQILPAGHAEVDTKLFKRVAGTFTVLSSVDTTWATNDILKLEIRGTALKVYKNGVEILSSTDSSISAAGKAGILWGQITPNGSNVNSTWRGDNFSVTEYASSGWSNIAKVNGVASSTISKVNGVTKTSISKVNGIAV